MKVESAPENKTRKFPRNLRKLFKNGEDYQVCFAVSRLKIKEMIEDVIEMPSAFVYSINIFTF